MPKLRNGNNGDSNPGSLDCESGILPTELPRSTNQLDMIMDVFAREIKDLSPWCMLYDYYIVLCGTRREAGEKKLEQWRRLWKT